MNSIELFQFAHHEWGSLRTARREDAFGFLKRLEELCDSSTNLYVVDMRPDDPLMFQMDRVLENVNLRGGGMRLGDYPDLTYMRNDVAPYYQACKQSGETSIMRMRSKIQDQVAVYDRIIMPVKPKGDHTWSVSITKTRMLLPTPPAVLTPKEQDILDLLAQGYSAKEIAAKMSMSHRTVEHRIESVKTKLGAKNVAHAVAIGIARYLTST
jgi:DNA-binding CsgD family transcriptional regulator